MPDAKPLALGIHWAHDASAALVSPDGVLAAVQEERLSRIKHHYGFPRQAIAQVFKTAGVRPEDVSLLAFSTRHVFYPEYPDVLAVEADGSARAASGPGTVPGADAAKALDEAGLAAPANTFGPFAERHYLAQRSFLLEMGLWREGLRQVHVAHHLAHASAAFRLSGLTDACVLTVDGKGDGLAATVYRGSPGGRLDLVRTTPAVHSLGSYYQAVTEALGFVPVDSEYKTMGLAAFAKDAAAHRPYPCPVRAGNAAFVSDMAWSFRDFNAANPGKKVPNPLGSVAQCEYFKTMLDVMEPTALAGLVQLDFERCMTDFAAQAMEAAGCRALAGAGGALLNVKANARIRDMLSPETFYVYPDAADSGLAVGAALEALYRTGADLSGVRLTSPYLGHEYSDAEITAELSRLAPRLGLTYRPCPPRDAAGLLVAGKVVGSFQGRLEMGPRALGNRSVLADPRSPAVKDRINGILKGREWYVPFAPAVMEAEAHKFWSGPTDYPHMTFAVTASPYALSAVPAVCHVDGTMRPQVVSAASNPWLHRVLEAFKDLTGVGLLLNTSFNRHGLPIVGSPEDALEHLAKGWVDGVLLGPYYVERQGGETA